MPDERYEPLNIGELRARLQREETGWMAHETAMSRLSDEEWHRHLGVPLPPGGVAEIEQRAAARRASILAQRAEAVGAPSAFDLRNVDGKNFITEIKDQNQCGSCVAFGTCATIEGTLRLLQDDPNLPVDLSEAHLFYCNAQSYGVNCGTGWYPDQALETCKTIGVVDEACYPYTPVDQNCTNRCADWQDRLYKVTDFHPIDGVADMKTWLSTKGPLIGCFAVYEDFRHYSSGVYRHVSGAQVGGHCVSIVGYDDALQCWICKNSWTSSWGESGFFRIGYGECGIDTWMVFAVDGVRTPEDHEQSEGIWQNDRRITGLWANDEERKAYAYADGLGWKRVVFNNDGIFYGLLIQLSTAKAADRPVNFYEEQGVIKQVYVL